MSSDSLSSGPLQARIGDDTYTLERKDGVLYLNGEALTDFRYERLDRDRILLVENGKPTVVVIEKTGSGYIGMVGTERHEVEIRTAADLLLESFGMDSGADSAAREVRAPMPGLVLRIDVAPGDEVTEGQAVAVLEAMKMENELKAPSSGVVATVRVEPGAAVGKNDLLIELEA